MIFLDSNIVIDVLERSSRWSNWSRDALEAAGAENALMTNSVVIAECAGHFDDLEQQLEYFDALGVSVRDLGAAAGRRAGRAHRAYRKAGGTRIGVLADFLIGGHASVLSAALLTRDRQRFSSYFPELTLITPDTHP